MIDVPESGGVEISAGAGQPQRPMSVRKPVVYAHLLDGVTESTFGLRVTLGAGSFVEHYPPATITGTTLEWPTIVAHAAHCDPAAAAARRTAPARMACASTDGICEIDELPRYDAPSTACLDVGTTDSSALLFYRGQAPSAALPITATRAADLTLTVAGREPISGVPGGLIRLSTAMSGPWPIGRVVITRAAFPGVGQSVAMPVGSEVITREQGIAALRTSIVALGLTDDEASAFMAGWADELFGADTAAREATRDLPARGAVYDAGSRHQDVLLFFLSPSAIDAITTLTPTPAPRAVRRAFLVRIDLGAVTTA